MKKTYTIYQFKYGYYYPYCEFRRREDAIRYFNYLRFNDNSKYILKDDENYIICKNYK